jgi:hypothetical protein
MFVTIRSTRGQVRPDAIQLWQRTLRLHSAFRLIGEIRLNIAALRLEIA